MFLFDLGAQEEAKGGVWLVHRIADHFIIVCSVPVIVIYANPWLSGVEPWTFKQNLGEAVFIPAGCPHQVRNLKVKYLLTYILLPHFQHICYYL